jgi:HEAT repeat protein
MHNVPDELVNLLSAIKSGDAKVCQKAVLAFEALGDRAASIIPELIECLLEESFTAEYARSALRVIGSVSISYLAQAFTNGSTNLRIQIVCSLWGGGLERSTLAIPLLVSAIKDQESEVRLFAAQSLGKIFSEYGEKLEDQEAATITAKALAGLLLDQNSKVQYSSSLALVNLGSKAALVVNELTEALHYDKNILRWVITALGNAGYPAHIAVNSIKDFLNDEAWIIRLTSIDAISQIGVNSSQVVMWFQERLSDPEEYVRLSAIRALSKLSYPSELLVESVENLLSERESVLLVGYELIEIIRSLGPAAQSFLPILEKLCTELTFYQNSATTPVFQTLVEIQVAAFDAITFVRDS